ncbi:hypothetical protein E2562_014367 [Oryza meyeriana var. granulata]|uniref:Uncharacterized protein n=1 Tax=Oryza meyeriana var. granulata TaxID=110450 RepID=A0A6G1C6F3_9ORYZ|nr:hypothetical protein E2562_014367 [Oryza meyeriana var. granulata]
MNASDGEQQGIHAHVVQQQIRRRITFSPQSKAFKVSGNRRSLSKTVARVVSRYRQSRVLKSQNKNNHAYGINCGCQPRCIVNVVKDIDDRKKELIGEIGFDGILDIKRTKLEDDQIARMIEEDTVSKQNPRFPFPRYGKLQAYDELKACLQDGFQLVDCILPCISDFVDLTNNQTATEAFTKYKGALKNIVVKAVKIAMKATVQNVIKHLDNFQGAHQAPGYPYGMGYHFRIVAYSNI